MMFALLSCSASNIAEKQGALLWKISGNGLEKPSYILGTHHLISQEFIDSIPGLMQSFNSADVMVGELILDDQLALQQEVEHAGMMPADTTYADLLSPGQLALLDEDLTALVGVGLQQFGVYKPAMISTILSLYLYRQVDPAINFATHQPIDAYLQLQAKASGKPIKGLETVADQVYALLESGSLQRQAESLICVLENKEFAVRQLRDMDRYYRMADLETLYTIGTDPENDPCPSTQEEKDILNKDRNDRWMSKLPEMMAQHSLFVAVGCLHLAGPEGLLEQFRQRGYRVEMIK